MKMPNKTKQFVKSLITTTIMGVIASPVIGSDFVLEEVIVTATKRATNLQDTAIAISAATQKDLEQGGINDLEDMASIVPGLNIATSGFGGDQLITLRGISSHNLQAVGDPTVAYHVDGVYMGRQTSGNAGYFDIDRIEVVKGPQGTLYGRNATAGSINVLPAKPVNEFEGAVGLVAGNYGQKGVTGMINIPVIDDKLAIRGAMIRETRDGFFEGGSLVNEDQNSLNETAYRLQALFTPNDDFSARLSYSNAGSKGVPSGFQRTTLPNEKLADLQDAYKREVNFQSSADDEWETISSEINWYFGPATLTYVAAYSESRIDHVSDYDGTAERISTLDMFAETEQVSHELRITSNSDGSSKWEWMGGVFLYDEDVIRDLHLLIDFVPGAPAELEKDTEQYDYNVESIAAFGQVAYDANEALRFTLGLRYTEDEKADNDRFDGLAVGNFNSATVTSVKDTWTSTDWKVGVELRYPEYDTMFYASVGTGYKAGGFNNPANDDNPSYAPEDILAYQVGHKSQFLYNRLQVNSEIFYYDYSDLQMTELINAIFLTDNAGKAVIYGFESSLIAALSESFRLDAAVSYLHTELSDAIQFDPITGIFEDLDGNNMANAPKWSLQVGLEFDVMLPGDYILTPRINFAYEDEIKFRHFDDPGSLQESSTKTDINLTLESPDSEWLIQAFVHNIEDKDVYSALFVNGDNSRAIIPRSPRTYGMRVTHNF